MAKERSATALKALAGKPRSAAALKTMAEDPTAMQFYNTGIATGLGGPIDLANYGLGFLGLGSDEPFMGSESIRKGLAGWGELFGAPMTAPEGAQPKTLPQRIGRVAGEATGMAPLMGLGAQAAAARGTGTAAEVGKSMLEGVARHPWATLVGETAAIAGAGKGGQIAAELFPGSPTAELYGELLGGFGGGTAAAAVKPALRGGKWLAERTPVVGGPVRAVTRGIPAAIAPFTKAGARIRAEDRVQGLVADPEATAAKIREDTVADMTPAQKSEDKHLLALEKAVLDENVKLEAEFAERTSEATHQLRDELSKIGEGGDVKDARRHLVAMQDRLTAALKLRVDQALDLAAQRIAALTPERKAIESSVIVREEVERALGAARKQEKVEWGKVDPDIEAPLEKTKQAYNDRLAELTEATRDDMPGVARRLLGEDAPPDNPFEAPLEGTTAKKWDDTQTVHEMRGLYSKLREVSRKARAAGDYNEARIADDIADGILDDFADVESVNDAFNAARRFSYDLNSKFKDGPVGRILGRNRTGGQRTPPELTLQTTAGRSGDRGYVEATRILEAAPSAKSEIGEFVMGNFQKAAAPNGVFSPTLARKFATENNLLAEYPDLKRAMLEAADAYEVGVAREARLDNVSKGLGKTSHTREFLGAHPHEEIQRVIKADNPRASARQLRRQARRDKTGKALAGLKSAVMEHLIEKSSVGAADEAGELLLSGNTLKHHLKNKETLAVLEEILAPKEMRRVKRIAHELSKLEAGKGRLPNVHGVMNDTPSVLLSMAARVLAAQAGRGVAGKMGGGTVQTPGIFSNRAQKVLERVTNDTAHKLIVDAVQDDDLFVALLQPLRGVKGEKLVARKFNAWVAGPGARLVEALFEGDGDE